MSWRPNNLVKTSGTRSVAKRNTSLPFIVMGSEPPPSLTGVVVDAQSKWQAPVPSLPISKPSNESSSGFVDVSTRAGTVTEQHASVPVAPIHPPRQRVCADHDGG